MILCENKSFAEVANEVLEKLIEQGGKCLDAEGRCQYRNEKGQHCAVGWLLPENFNSKWDAENLCKKEKGRLGVNEGWIQENTNKLEALQMFHDTEYGFDELLELGVNKELMERYVEL